MPLQVWVQAVQHGLSIVEVPVPLIYLDESRAFGGALDDGDVPAEPLSPGVQSRPAAGRVWKCRGGVVDEAAPPAGSLDRRRLAGGASPGPGGRARSPRTPRSSPTGITTFRADAPAGCVPWPAIRSSSRRGVSRRATAWTSRTGPTQTAPLVVTGHQSELFHPGVWIKNFAAGAIAAESAGSASTSSSITTSSSRPRSASPKSVPSGSASAASSSTNGAARSRSRS